MLSFQTSPDYSGIKEPIQTNHQKSENNLHFKITTDAFDFNIYSAAKWHNQIKSKKQRTCILNLLSVF
jgi:hypothetical protein